MEPHAQALSKLEQAVEALNSPALLAKNPALKEDAHSLLADYAEEHAFSGIDFLELFTLSHSLNTQYWALTVLGQLLQKPDYYVAHYSLSKRSSLD